MASLDRWSGTTHALLRILTGAYLAAATWGAMPGQSRVAGIASGLVKLDLPSTAALPPLGATVQFAAGVLLIVGLLTRWAGLAVALLFTVAIIRSGLNAPLGSGWPTLLLLVLGLHFAAAGAGAYALDGLFGRRGKRR
ncbi:MAG: DoxX family protein [Novosphingobium sp.]